MMTVYGIYQQPVWMISIFCLFMVWDLVWKGLGLWYAGKHQQKAWFIFMLVLNTVGILPIIYLLWFKPKEKAATEIKSISVKRKRK